MLTIYLVKKEKGRVYRSADIVSALTGRKLLHNEDGAPFFEDGSSFISISDTRNYWACCVSPEPVGIDMEEQGRQVRPAVTKRFHKDEREYLAVLSEGSREWRDEFFAIWTKKEAWSKLKGKGYAIGFAGFSVLDPAAEGIPVAGFTWKDLYFGIAGDSSAEVILKDYDAPMEKSALDYAAELLDARAYSEGALSSKLSERGYCGEEIELALEKLREYGYVNDKAFAENYARRGSESGKGVRRIERELSDRGIDKELAKEAALEYKDGEYQRAFDIAEKILSKYDAGGELSGSGPGIEELSKEEKKELWARKQKLAGKVSRKLSSLGYDASVIWSVIEDLGI